MIDHDNDDPHPTGVKSSASAPARDSSFCPLCTVPLFDCDVGKTIVISGFVVHEECARRDDAVIDLAELAYPTAIAEMRKSANAVPLCAAGHVVYLSDGRVFSYNESREVWTSLPDLPLAAHGTAQ